MISVEDYSIKFAAEAYGWDPKVISINTRKNLQWRCSVGHIWEKPPFTRKRSKANGCDYCLNRKLLVGFNDLATTHPRLASEAYGWNPAKVKFNSKKEVAWQCSLGHHWDSSPRIRTLSAHSRCLICVNQIVLPGFNDLATTHPEIASQAYGWDPTLVTAGSDAKRSWKCELGHIWPAPAYSRTGSEKTGCGVCHNRQLWVGFNDLATIHPTVAREAYGWDPGRVLFGSNTEVDWKCPIGHIWQGSPNARTSTTKMQCFYCSNKKRVLNGFNDLLTVYPEVASEAYGWDPSKVLFGTNANKAWKCKFGHSVWTTSVNLRTGFQKTGCPECSSGGGFRGTKPAHLYILKDKIEGEEIIQFGISNKISKRLATHANTGFVSKPLALIYSQNGNVIRVIERNIKAYMKHYEIPNCSQRGIRFDGSTESFLVKDMASEFSLKFEALVEGSGVRLCACCLDRDFRYGLGGDKRWELLSLLR